MKEYIIILVGQREGVAWWNGKQYIMIAQFCGLSLPAAEAYIAMCNKHGHLNLINPA